MSAIDILGWNIAAECAVPFDVELLHADGVTKTGIIVQVIGKHADVVQDFTQKLLDKLNRDAEYARRRGKDIDPPTMGEVRAQNAKGAVVRVVGWKNVQQPFTPELAEKVFILNPHWVDQIIGESNNLGNYTKAPSAN